MLCTHLTCGTVLSGTGLLGVFLSNPASQHRRLIGRWWCAEIIRRTTHATHANSNLHAHRMSCVVRECDRLVKRKDFTQTRFTWNELVNLMHLISSLTALSTPPPVPKFAAYRVNLLFALNNNVGLQQESWGTLPGLRRLAVGWHSRQCCATPSCWRHSCTTNSPDWYQQRPLQVAQRYQQASSKAVGRVPTTKHARRTSLKTDAMRWTAPDMSVPLFQKTFSS